MTPRRRGGSAAPEPPQLRPATAVDRCDREQVAGWSWYPQAPERRVTLQLADGADVIATFTADRCRPDLVEAGIGDGCYAFEFRLPLYLRAGEARELRLLDAATGEVQSELSLPPAYGSLDELLPALHAALAHGKPEQGAAGRWLVGLLPVVDRLLEVVREPPADAESPFVAEVLRARERFGRLAFRVPDRCDVSVIIPVHNRFDLTWACLASLHALPDRTPFEVIVVDDASQDETLLLPLLAPGVRVLRNAGNLGFVGSVNAGAAIARGDLLFFLNNDTEMHAEALDRLVAVLQEEPETGIVGARMLNADGTLQEAGGAIFRLADGANVGRGAAADDPRYAYRRDVDYVSGAAMLVRRSLFEALGAFDDAFAPGYYEDTDLCFRARAAGWRVRYQPRAAVTHHEGGTAGRDLTQGMKRHQVLNARRFLLRWREVLAGHASSLAEVEAAKDRGTAFRVLFLDANLPTPTEDAGSQAAACHIRLIQAMGGKVTLMATAHMGLQGRDGECLQDQGVEVLHYPHVWSVEEVLRRRGGEFDVIYIHRFEVAQRHMETCRALAPRARLVYNLADLHFLREERENAVTGARDTASLARARDSELAAIARADAIIVHSPEEETLLGQLGHRHVHVVPWAYAVRNSPGAAQRDGLLFVGGYRHRPNVDGALWFVHEVWPALRQRHPQLSLTLAGSHPPPELRALSGQDGIDVPGHLSELDTLYRRHRLAVAPLRFGAGLKGKVLEAMAWGLPCVGTAIAYEGLAFDQAAQVIADGAAAMTGRIETLLSDDAAWEQVRRAGQEWIAEGFSDGSVLPRLKRALLVDPEASGRSAATP